MKNIDHVTESDVNRWEKTIEKSLPVLLHSIESGKTQQGRRYYQLYREYRSMASVYYVREEISKAGEALLKSAKSYLMLLDEYKSGGQVKPGFISYTDYQAMLLPLIAGDLNLAKSIAIKFQKEDSHVSESKFFEEVCCAIKYSILGQHSLALKHSNNAVELGFNTLDNFARLLSTIISNKSNNIDELFEKCLNDFDNSIRSDSVGMPVACIFLDGLGIISLSNHLNGRCIIKEINDQRLDYKLINKLN